MRASAGRSMWGTMAKARLLQKTFTLPFCSFKFCSWFSTRKKARLPSKTFLLHHHLHRYLSSSTKIWEENLCRRFCNTFPIFLRPSSTNKKYGRRRFFFLKRQFLWPRLMEWEDNGKRKKWKSCKWPFLNFPPGCAAATDREWSTWGTMMRKSLSFKVVALLVETEEERLLFSNWTLNVQKPFMDFLIHVKACEEERSIFLYRAGSYERILFH